MGPDMANNVISIAEWKAKHRQRRVPVYVPVRDADGKWQLELVGTTTLDAELRIEPKN